MKKQEKMSKQKRKDSLTNWYMINLSWGVVGILLLYFVSQLYRYASFIAVAQPVMWTVTAIFAVSAVVLFILGKNKHSLRLTHYGWFLASCTLFGLWLALYNKIRPMLESLLHSITGNTALVVSSYWSTWIPMIAIGIYLVLSFIWYLIQLAKNK